MEEDEVVLLLKAASLTTAATPSSTAGAAEEEEAEAGEDALPDWTQFSKSLASSSHDSVIPFIPRRGEKDFEPLLAPSLFPLSSNDHLLSQYQQNTLTDSRNALFSALSSGSRHHSSKAHNKFTWRPDLEGGRASLDGKATFGNHFGTMGVYDQKRKRLELLPEEVLFLVERGGVELWREGDSEDDGTARVPMSVQETWSETIGKNELTLERFLIYAYLKRLGYIVTRARPPLITSSKAVATSRPNRSFFSVFLKLFSSPLTTLRALFFPPPSTTTKPLGITRLVKKGEGILTSLVGFTRWTSYQQIFSRLQIIPTGFTKPLPRGPLPHPASILESPAPAPPLPIEVEVPPENLQPSLVDQPYQVFWNVYKPATKFKKSSPGEPDFQIVVINTATTPLPDLFEFVEMFSHSSIPPEPLPRGPSFGPPPPSLPTSTNTNPSTSTTSTPTPTPTPNTKQSSRQTRPFRPRPPPPAPTFLQKFLPSFLLPTPKTNFKPKKPSPYPKLKMGRRSVIIAVVDGGTTSFLKFGESEFGKVPWEGVGRIE